MNYLEAEEHKDYLAKEITISEAIQELEKLKAKYGGDSVLHIQSHGCCRHNHPAWIVDYDEDDGEAVIRG